MPATFNKSLGSTVQKTHITQIIDALDGTAGKGIPIKMTQVSDNASAALTIKNSGTGGALVVQKSDGTTLFSVSDSGVFITGAGLDSAGYGRLILLS
jgi:hypothetical protein